MTITFTAEDDFDAMSNVLASTDWDSADWSEFYEANSTLDFDSYEDEDEE